MKPGMFDNLLPPLPPSIEERLAAGDKEALIGGKRAASWPRLKEEQKFVDADGEKRFYFSDAGAKLNTYKAQELREHPSHWHPLSDMLLHPRLFEEYPDLRHITVRFVLLPPGMNGGYDPKEKSIFINRDADDERVLRTLLHESQHAVQNIERMRMVGLDEIEAAAKKEKGLSPLERQRRVYDIYRELLLEAQARASERMFKEGRPDYFPDVVKQYDVPRVRLPNALDKVVPLPGRMQPLDRDTIKFRRTEPQDAPAEEGVARDFEFDSLDEDEDLLYMDPELSGRRWW